MGTANATATTKEPETLLTDVTVITMDDERRAFANGYVWMKDGRIHRVGLIGPRASCLLPRFVTHPRQHRIKGQVGRPFKLQGFLPPHVPPT